MCFLGSKNGLLKGYLNSFALFVRETETCHINRKQYFILVSRIPFRSFQQSPSLNKCKLKRSSCSAFRVNDFKRWRTFQFEMCMEFLNLAVEQRQ
jgi:hypothetical protein